MNLKILKYDFRIMKISEMDNAVFTRDLILCKDWFCPVWSRKDSHKLQYCDLEHPLSYMKPNILVVGTGLNGILRISDEFKNTIKDLGIDIYVDKTPVSVTIYNRLSDYKNMQVMGAFHISC